jgi:hypothetical protein
LFDRSSAKVRNRRISPVANVPAKVGLAKLKLTFDPGDGDYSSCPNADTTLLLKGAALHGMRNFKLKNVTADTSRP